MARLHNVLQSSWKPTQNEIHGLRVGRTCGAKCGGGLAKHGVFMMALRHLRPLEDFCVSVTKMQKKMMTKPIR
jgi:hypothetical protein